MIKNKPESIWKFIDKLKPDECWPYIGGTFSGRYGRFYINGNQVLAHRHVYELVNGEISIGQFVMHKCNNKLCCNPCHLTIGSNSENQRHASGSGAFKVGKTGIHGVSFDDKRKYWTAQGYRNNKKINLYTGPNKDKAISARAKWEKQNLINFKEVKNMNTFDKSAAQGDLYIKVVDEIPAGLSEAKKEKGQYVLAHSESGHNHVIDGNCVRVFHQDEFISYVECKKSADIVHLRSFHTHAPISLKPGQKYRVSRQREYIPEGYRRAAD